MIGKVILGTVRELNTKPITGKPGKLKHLIHDFLTKYNILIGRNILHLTKVHINFEEEYVKLNNIIFNFTSKQERKLASASRSLYTLAVIIIKFINTKNYIPNSIR